MELPAVRVNEAILVKASSSRTGRRAGIRASDEIKLVRAEPQPAGMRQAQLHEIVDDEHRSR